MSENLIIIADRVKETSMSQGTGEITLDGASNGFTSFGSVYSSGNALFYAITDGVDYEVGSGIFHTDGSSTNLLERKAFRSSNSNNNVTWGSSNKEVYVTYPATHSVYMGSGISDLSFPQTSGLAFWASSNILNYDSDIIWDTTNNRLGIQQSSPSYSIDIGGVAESSSVQASGFYVGSSGVVFPAAGGYAGGKQLMHFEQNQTESTTGSDLVIDLSGVVNEYVLLKQQDKGTVFAGPPSGCVDGSDPCSPNYPTFRTLTLEDIPDLSSLYSAFSDITAVSGQLESDSIARSGALQTQIDANNTTITNSLASVSGNLNTEIVNNRNIFTITKSSSTPETYVFSGVGTDASANPNIFVKKGLQYKFDIDTVSEPFCIKTAPTTGGTVDLYSTGVTNNVEDSGVISFVIPINAPDLLYYSSSASTGMSGIIYTTDDNGIQDATDYTNIEAPDTAGDDKMLLWDSSASEFKSIPLSGVPYLPSGNSYIKYETILQSSSTGDLGEMAFNDTYAYFRTGDGWKRTRIYPFQPADNSNCTTPSPCSNGEYYNLTGAYNEDPNSDYYGCPEYSACGTTTTTTTATPATTTTTTADPASFTSHIYTWGYNGNSQLGFATTELFSLSPTKLETVGNIKHMSAGDFHVLAVDAQGKLYAWGWNIDGQLGDGTKVDVAEPKLVDSSKVWDYVAAGDHHSAGISEGNLYTWGGNSTGQLGNGNKASVLIPTQIGSNMTWTKVFCGTSHTFAINSLGELWGWGSNEFGQVGDGSFIDVLSPVKITANNNWKHISAYTHTLGITTDGECFAWGRNEHGQLGLNQTVTPEGDNAVPQIVYENVNTPTAITRRDGDNILSNAGAIENWKWVAAGYEHSVIINEAGELYVCGSNVYGQVGQGSDSANLPSFNRVGKERNWRSATAGNFHTIILSAAGDMYGMGRNNYGQLGNGNQSNVKTLSLISTDFDWDLPEAGYDFTAAVGAAKASDIASTTGVPLSNTLTIATGETSAAENRLDFRGTAGDALEYNLPADTAGTPSIARIKIGGTMVAQITFTSPYADTPARFTRGDTSYNFTLAAGDVDL